MKNYIIYILMVLVVSGCGSNGNGGASQTLFTPTSFTVTKDISSSNLSWDSVAGATSYEVYWSNSPNVTTSNNLIAVGDVTTYTHSNLSTQDYYYRVRAVNGQKISDLSAEQSVSISSYIVINPMPTPNTLWGGASNTTTSVVLGAHGTILTSTDGTDWVERSSGTTVNLRDITYAANLFVAVGDSGTVLTSPDGNAWTQRTSGSTENLNDIIFTNNTFFVVGNNGVIISSSDSISWSAKTSNSTQHLLSITDSGSLLVAVGTADHAIYSSGGNSWTASNVMPSKVYAALHGVEWIGSEFFAVGDMNAMYKSADAITWTKVFQSMGHFFDIKNTINGLVALGSYSSSAFRVISYDSGATWSPHSLTGGRFYTSLHEFNGKHYFTGTFGSIYETSNFSAFTRKTSAYEPAKFTASATDGTSIIAAGGGNNSVNFGHADIGVAHYIAHAFTSDEFTNSTYTYISGKLYYGATYANGEFIKVGSSGTFTYSPDNSVWTTVITSTASQLHDVVHNGALYVAVGINGTIITSTDKSVWFTRNTAAYTLNSIEWTGTEFIAVGNQSKILRSPDGITWTESDLRTPATDTLTSITTQGSKYVVTASSGIIFTSSDQGATWSIATTLSEPANDVYWTGSNYIVSANNGTFGISTDTITWTETSIGTPSSLNTAVRLNNNVYLFGAGGLIVKTGI